MSQTIRKRNMGADETAAKDSSKAIFEENQNREQKCLNLKFLVILFGFIFISGLIAYITSPVQAVPIEDVVLPPSEGIFALNENLSKNAAARISLQGPESIAEDADMNLYTGLLNGTIVKIYPENGVIGAGRIEVIANVVFDKDFTTNQWKHGRPLGIRVRGNILYCADAIYGIYAIDLASKNIERLVKPCDADPCMLFPDDLDITADGKYIYFSDLSTDYVYDDMAYEVLDGTASGRIFQYSLESKKLEKVIDNLGSANGVQLTENEKLLIVAETSRFRVTWFDVNTWQKKYVQNLPAMPDNVRRSNRGTYWVASSAPPPPGHGLLLRSPSLRQITAALPMSLLFKIPKRGHNIAIEVTGNGEVLRTLHDTQGKVTFALAQATELSDGRLALSSYIAEFLSFVKV